MYEKFGKRLFDFSLAFFAILPAVLVCLICIILIKADSPGPAIFRQVRVGRGRSAFTLYKLRTMASDTESRASHEISSKKVTRVGSILRNTKLDELPQLINVLRGDMSFVGPRPCLPSQEVLVTEREKRGVYTVRPGITGPAQLAGIDMSTPVTLAEVDATYLRGNTFRRDLGLIAATALGQGSGDAVKDS